MGKKYFVTKTEYTAVVESFESSRFFWTPQAILNSYYKTILQVIPIIQICNYTMWMFEYIMLCKLLKKLNYTNQFKWTYTSSLYSSPDTLHMFSSCRRPLVLIANTCPILPFFYSKRQFFFLVTKVICYMSSFLIFRCRTILWKKEWNKAWEMKRKRGTVSSGRKLN